VPEAFFAPCNRGLEQALCAELGELGIADPRAGHAGVHFTGGHQLCYRVNLKSRIATRVLWRIGHCPYRNEDDIYACARELPWPQWFSVDRSIMVTVNARRSPLKSLDFVTLRIKDAVCDRFREGVAQRPSVDTRSPDMRIQAYLTTHELTLYLDTSGEPLFKRRLRPGSSEAPLKKNLAAGILRLSGWKPGEPLLDPMCGSGTFLIEAGEMALGIDAGAGRGFAFQKMHLFDPDGWRSLTAEAEAARRAVHPLSIYGSELYGSALKSARINLAASGLEGAVELKQANVLDISPPAPTGVLVTNLPYGMRMADQEKLSELYPKLGDALKKKFAGWRACLFTADLRLPKLIGLSAARRTPVFNGALECRLFEYVLVSGGMRA
jgi:23S rRNA (guanine2445-N2)-methyltransferase